MKKIIIYCLLITATATQAFAQKDAEARAILNGLSKKYHSYDIVKSDFSFTIEDQQNQSRQTQQGTLIIQAKTNKFKLTLYAEGSTSVAQEIISDGKNQWTYLAKDKEVQLNKVDNSDGGFNPAQMFTIYEKGFKYIFTGTEAAQGKIYQTVDLTPEDIDKSYFKIRLTIDKAKKQLYSALIFNKDGNRYSYTINTFTPNVRLPESIFTYDAKAHSGVEVVDLR